MTSTRSTPDDLGAAIGRELCDRAPGTGGAPATPPGVRVSSRYPAEPGDLRPEPVLVSGTAADTAGSVVVAAIDDDANPGCVVGYAAAQARRLQVPLRAVHVWTGRTGAVPGPRRRPQDLISDADHLLSSVLYDYLPPDEADATEREILHDPDVVQALISVSAEACLMVIAARSGPVSREEPLGDTARALVGRTTCPLAVLPVETEKIDTGCPW